MVYACRFLHPQIEMNSNSIPQTGAPQPQDKLRTPPRFPVAIVFFVWLLVMLIATLVTFILPEAYVSSARINIEREQLDVVGFAERGTTAGYDPYFIQTEFELLQSEVILGKVVDDLDLNREWGKKYAGGERLKTPETTGILRNRLDLRPVRNTSLLEIRVFSEKPEEAATIANAIAEVYRKHRLDQRKERRQGAIKALEEDHEANIEKIRSTRAHIAELSQKPDAANTNRLEEARKSLEELQRFGDILFMKIASEQVDLSLPATSMVQIVDTAKPGTRPVRPNKPLNILIGIIVGAVGGLFLATLVYVLQRREFRRISGAPKTHFPPRFRAVVHILIALVVGVVVGYHCATPLSLDTIIVVPLTLLLGGIASAYIELANPRLPSEPAPVPDQAEPTDAAL
jgi:capsular polysaccharide biosynthesis protein